MTVKRLKKLPIGIADFRDLRKANYCYVDKSLFIKELIDAGPGKVALIPRPRRFGKTINMTMLRYFFEKYAPSATAEGAESEARIFDGLEITKHLECMAHQGRYPVIFLTFKDIKEDAWEKCYDKLKECIAAEFQQHSYLLQSKAFTQQQQEDFNQIISRKASPSLFENALKNLSKHLADFYKQKPVILIDEYDSPIHAGFIGNYYEKIISFMRGFMCGGLKDNSNLAYGVVTGILRVSKESIFSGMNNLHVCSLLSDHYADKFGFTDDEVKELLAAYHLSFKEHDVLVWYDGYRVGQPKNDDSFITLYNPWSLLNFINENGVLGPYWANTSDNRLVQDLVRRASEDVKSDFELILTGKPVTKKICEDVVFPSIYNDSNALWSFFVFTGYLTWQSRERMQVKCKADLVVPNDEVMDCLKTLVTQWFAGVGGSSAYQNMLGALCDGDVALFERYFQDSVLDHLSFFDVSGKTPECVYHAYVLGILVGLEATHEVTSNREVGKGRYDVCIAPHDISKPGTIIEFKVFNPKIHKDMAVAAQEALEQIEQKQYDTELRSRGIKNIIKLAIVFDKKEVLIVEAQ